MPDVCAGGSRPGGFTRRSTNPRTGEQIFPALEPGSELGWRDHAGGPEPRDINLSYFRDVLFKNPQWDFRTVNFDSDVALADKADRGVTNAINPDLGAFPLSRRQAASLSRLE